MGISPVKGRSRKLGYNGEDSSIGIPTVVCHRCDYDDCRRVRWGSTGTHIRPKWRGGPGCSGDSCPGCSGDGCSGRGCSGRGGGNGDSCSRRDLGGNRQGNGSHGYDE